ncbi:Exonuclease [Macleaya cordata]|uniref:RNA exonuclease 4 n=1 Tax=Macleaya cordata TaxID=56857 RepID=A0A200RBI1_MACCD|nr:Exonuclease [Macleaya cordata]
MVHLVELDADTPKTITIRHKCSACFKQYKKKEHLLEHMKLSYHSVHQPKCDVCKKHCKSFESLREHITGPLPKSNCAKIFNAQGCHLCMKIFDSSDALSAHKEMCYLSPAPPIEFIKMPSVELEMEASSLTEGNYTSRGPEVVAIDCEMVGGGSDGSLDLCGRVCLIDEDENVIFHTYVEPQIPVTDYRYEITGITEEHLRDAMPLKQVQEKIEKILYNGESIWRTRLEGGNARLLVGHDLDHDLDCLRMNYPDHLLRDTAKYRPLMKTNLCSHPLKYLSRTYLGYEIQSGTHDPYEDCVAAMRLYKRMRAQVHPLEGITTSSATHFYTNSFDSRTSKELDNMSPDALFEISRSNYRCWCLDSRPKLQS